MSTEEKLREFILLRYKSVREFAQVANIPYTTIRSILERGIDNSSVGNVIKICKSLNISADALANGEIEYKRHDRSTQITDVRDIVDDAKALLTGGDHLVIDGKPIDIEVVEPIMEALDIGYEMVKRKSNKENTITKTITKP